MEVKNSQPILTEEQKKYLRKCSRYFRSYALKYADIKLLEFDNSYCEGFDIEDYNFGMEGSYYLSNNYTVEVPLGLNDIIKDMVTAGLPKLNNDVDCPEYIDYGSVDCEINIESEEIRIRYYIGYTEPGHTDGIEYSVADEGISKEVFDQVRRQSGGDNIMRITYDGSGDSGYISDRFDNGMSVPAGVEDWCSYVLSGNFGGWENNEGSQGSFDFDLESETVTLNHAYNIQESEAHTICEDKFGK